MPVIEIFKKIASLLRLFRRAFGQYKMAISSLVILSFFNGIFEGIGITTIIPIFSFVSKGRVDSLDIVTKTIEKVFLFSGVPFTLKYLLILLIILFIAKSAVLFFASYISSLITAKYERVTRAHLFKITLESDWPYLSTQRLGYLDQVITTDVNTSSGLFFNLTSFIIIVTKLLVYITIAINLSIPITLMALLLGVLVMFVFKPLFFKSKQMSELTAMTYKKMAHFINENILGMKTVKSLLAEKKVVEKGTKYFDEVKRLNIKAAVAKNITNALMQPIGLVFIMSLFAFSYKTQLFDFGTFAVIVYAINQIFTLIQMFQAQLHGMVSAAPYLKSILDYQDMTKNSKEADAGQERFRFDKSFRFNNVGFSYNKDKKVLDGVDFSINKGKMIGLIGASGAGKTTIVDLLLRLLRAEKGKITVDGIDIEKISINEWRSNVGYVSQDIFLMNDTIANNIRFYEDSLAENDIIEGAKTANIHDFIEGLPDKYDTIVGERGILLSNGQRQRIALARVLARRQNLLILDEATSALDNESEMLIQEAIERLKGKITILVIAHRLSTVMATDKIIVLENGKIIEEGKPDDLLKDCKSYFYKVYNIRELA
ncbi:MAG: ABC transporter ATP-binding protein [Patescibacteria group bacterium]